MSMTEPLTVGVEEEYLVVDEVSGALLPRANHLTPHAGLRMGAAVALLTILWVGESFQAAGFSWGRVRVMGPAASMTRARAALAEWNP